MKISDISIKTHFDNLRVKRHIIENMSEYSNVTLSNTILDNAKINNKNFNKKSFIQSSLEDVDGRESSFIKANFYNASLIDADFGDANFTKANMSFANASDANFDNANLSEVLLKNATLINTYFVNANLTNAKITHSDATKANFSGANLTGANFNHTIITNANFHKANLTDCSFTGAKINQNIIIKRFTIIEDVLVFKTSKNGLFFSTENDQHVPEKQFILNTKAYHIVTQAQNWASSIVLRNGERPKGNPKWRIKSKELAVLLARQLGLRVSEQTILSIITIMEKYITQSPTVSHDIESLPNSIKEKLHTIKSNKPDRSDINMFISLLLDRMITYTKQT